VSILFRFFGFLLPIFAVTTKLPADRFPRLLNEAICGDDLTCLNINRKRKYWKSHSTTGLRQTQVAQSKSEQSLSYSKCLKCRTIRNKQKSVSTYSFSIMIFFNNQHSFLRFSGNIKRSIPFKSSFQKYYADYFRAHLLFPVLWDFVLSDILNICSKDAKQVPKSARSVYLLRF
jgi:hypothetical protein